VAVGAPAIISCGRTAGGVRVQVLEFLQHSVCTGTLYCVLIARTQGADSIRIGPYCRSLIEILGTQIGEDCGGRAVAARRARRSRDTVVGRPAPHARWSAVGHHPGPRRLESWERLKELTSGPLGRGGAAERGGSGGGRGRGVGGRRGSG
jgi:hypothetical protein